MAADSLGTTDPHGRIGPLVSVAQLRALQGSSPRVVLLDCGFDLFDPAAGRRAWESGHLPGAIYAHLDEHLSGAKSARGPVEGGRHPLPDRAAWAALVGRWGIEPNTWVVAHDDQGGPYAARAWWMLRWIGHERVAVLDGGKGAWVAEGGSLQSAPAAQTAEGASYPYPLGEPAMRSVTADDLLSRLGRATLIDARAAERYLGKTEPLDTRAGHIPGALNRFFKDNLQPDGRFKSVEQLRAEWAPLLPSRVGERGPDATTVIHQCGSGVTACHNLLALAHAGLGEGVLYPGSWSEWSADPTRPCAMG